MTVLSEILWLKIGYSPLCKIKYKFSSVAQINNIRAIVTEERERRRVGSDFKLSSLNAFLIR